MIPDFEVLTTSRFYLELRLDSTKELIDAYFSECSGFKRSQDVIEIAEVTRQKWGRSNKAVGRVARTKLPGNSKSENITLKFGLTTSDTLWKWFEQVERGEWSTQQRYGDITIYDQGGVERARFRFTGAWPVSYKISDMKADSSDFQIEELELAVDEFVRVTSDKPSE